MRATRIASAILALALALALVGCKGEEKKDETRKVEKKAKKVKQAKKAAPEGTPDKPVEKPDEPVEKPDEPVEKPPKKPATKPVLLESKALEMIPGSALMVAAVTGIEPLADLIGWAELRTIKRDWYEIGVAAVVQFVGHNVLDFANLPEIGVDPNAPIGFAWLSWEGEAFAAWIQLTDPEKFKLTLYKLGRLAKKTIAPENMGDALILSFRGEGEVKVVLRGDFAFLVFSEDGEKEAMGFARRVASTDRTGSILEVERFQSLMGALESGRDGAMYLDVATLIGFALDRSDPARKEAQQSWAETELKNAKERGADKDELGRMEQRLERYRKHQKAEEELARSLWGSLGAVAVGAEIGVNSVNAHALAAVNGGMIIELFGRSEGRPLITKVVSGKPWFLAGATVDVATYRTLFEKLLATEGTEWSEVEEGARELLGVEKAQDVLALLDGQLGFYMGGKLVPGSETSESFQDLEGGGYVGIKDGEKTSALLEKIAAHPEVAKLVRMVDGGWEITVPEWRTVYVKVVDGYLAAATNTAFIDRVAKGDGGDWPASMGNKDLAALFTESEANAAWMMDMGLVGYMTFASFRGKMEVSAEEVSAEATAGPDDAPYSQAWKDKKGEIEDTEKSVEEARNRLEKEEFEVVEGLYGAFGVTAAVGGPGPKGLQIQGGQYFGLESIPAVAKEVARRAFEMEALSSRRNTEVWQRQDGIWRMREELRRLREIDIENHMQKKADEEMKPRPAYKNLKEAMEAAVPAK